MKKNILWSAFKKKKKKPKKRWHRMRVVSLTKKIPIRV